MFCSFMSLFNVISGFIEDSWVLLLFLFSICCHISCRTARKLLCTLVREQEGRRQIMLDHLDKNSFDLADPLKGSLGHSEFLEDTLRTAVERESCYSSFPVDGKAAT